MPVSQQTLRRSRDRLAQQIRDFVTAKHADWQQVPYWALQAIGTDNTWSGQDYSAFTRKVWHPNVYHGSPLPLRGLAVDLQRVEIIRSGRTPDDRTPPDAELLLLLEDIDEFDGSKVLADFKERAHVTGCKCSDCEDIVSSIHTCREYGKRRLTLAQYRKLEAERLNLHL